MKEFSTMINRKNTNSFKWDRIKQIFATKDDDVLPMWVADMDFPAPKEVNEAIIERAQHGIYGYTYIADQIKTNVTDWLQNRHDWAVKTSSLTFSPSVLTSLYIAITTFTKPNDKIIIQTPVYTPFFNMIKGTNRNMIQNSLHFNGTSYEMDFNDLEQQMQEGAKAIIFCSPHNPVGRVWTKEELERLANLALKYNVLIFSDEIHADLVFNTYKHIPIASLSEEISNQTITFMSPTKTFNLAGLQVSYFVTTDSTRQAAMEKQLAVQGFNMLNVMGVTALDAAYRHGKNWLNQLIKIIEANKQYVMERLPKETNGKVQVIDSEGTYLLWLDFNKLNLSDKELNRFLIEKAKVALNAGSSYGTDGEQFMRINLACHKDTLVEGINRIVNAVNND